MLEKLDTIDWSSLSHAYGDASDVPDLIRDLLSTDQETRNDAIYGLYGNIWHQGTVYEATAYAVPFLIELAGAESVPGKVGILALLSDIADGSSYLDFHGDRDSFFTERNSEKFTADLSQELEFARLTHEAVVDGTPVFLSLLSVTNIETKVLALYTLSTCVEQAVSVEAALWEKFVIEKEPQVKASMMLCLRNLWRRQFNPLQDFATPSQGQLYRMAEVMRSAGESPLVRFSAALSLVGWLDAEARDEAFLEVEELANANWQAFSSLPWSAEDSTPIDTVTSGFNHLPELRLRFQLGLLQNQNNKIRRDVIFALGELCRDRRSYSLKVVPVLGELLGDADSEIRWWAAMTLAGLGSATRLAAEPLLAALSDANAKVRSQAAIALAKIGEARAVPKIRGLLHNPETAVSALNALSKLGPRASDAIDDLRALLPKPANGLDPVKVILTLGEIDHTGKSSLADVAALLCSPYGGTAAWVLSTWGTAAQSCMEDLITALDSPNELTRQNAVRALGNIGTPAAKTIPKLTQMLETNDVLLKVRCAIALWAVVRSELTVPILTGILEQGFTNRDRDLQLACSLAAEYLGEIGAEASNATSILKQALQHPSVHLRVHAACSLWEITRQADEALPVLIQELRTFAGAKTIMNCLAAMGPLAKPAIPELQKIIESQDSVLEIGIKSDWIDKDEAFRQMARETLKAILQQ